MWDDEVEIVDLDLPEGTGSSDGGTCSYAKRSQRPALPVRDVLPLGQEGNSDLQAIANKFPNW